MVLMPIIVYLLAYINDAGNRLGTPHPLFLTPSTRPSDGCLPSRTLRVLYCPSHFIHLKKMVGIFIVDELTRKHIESKRTDGYSV